MTSANPGHATEERNWSHFCKCFCGLRPLFSGRRNEALQALGLPPNAPSNPLIASDAQKSLVMAALHQIGLNDDTLQDPNLAWHQATATFLVMPKVKAAITRWLCVPSNLDMLVPSEVPTTPTAGGGGAAGLAAAASATSALNAISSSQDEKQIVQSMADGTWPEADVLLVTSDPAYTSFQAAISTGSIT